MMKIFTTNTAIFLLIYDKQNKKNNLKSQRMRGCSNNVPLFYSFCCLNLFKTSSIAISKASLLLPNP